MQQFTKIFIPKYIKLDPLQQFSERFIPKYIKLYRLQEFTERFITKNIKINLILDVLGCSMHFCNPILFEPWTLVNTNIYFNEFGNQLENIE